MPFKALFKWHFLVAFLIFLDSFGSSWKVPQPVIGPSSLTHCVVLSPVHLSPHHSASFFRPEALLCPPLCSQHFTCHLVLRRHLKGAFELELRCFSCTSCGVNSRALNGNAVKRNRLCVLLPLALKHQGGVEIFVSAASWSKGRAVVSFQPRSNTK